MASNWAHDVHVLTSLTQASFHFNGPSPAESKLAHRGSDSASTSTSSVDATQSSLNDASRQSRPSTSSTSIAQSIEPLKESHEKVESSPEESSPGSEEKYTKMLAASENTAWAQHVRSEQRDNTATHNNNSSSSNDKPASPERNL